MSQNVGSRWALLFVGIAVFGVLGVSCGPWQLASQDEKKARLVTKVISTGQDPKSALRFKVAKGDKQYVAFTTDVSLLMTTAFHPSFPLSSPQELLKYEQEWLVTVTDVAASGDVSFEVSIAKAELIPREDRASRAVQDMQRQIESRIGQSVKYVMSSRGVPKSYSNELNEGLNPVEQQFLEALEDYLPFVAIPFPKAPIGVGAKWSVTRPVESQGVSMKYVAVYELKKFENGTGTVTTKVERTTQPFHIPKTKDRSGNRFNRMTTTTTCTQNFSLEKILPETESLESTTETHMVIEFPTSNMTVIILVEATQKMADPNFPPVVQKKAPAVEVKKTEEKARLVTKLISAGQDPKSALRFKVAKGDKQYVAFTTDFERRMSFSLGFPLPQQGHVLQKLTLLATVTDVAASGDVSFEVSIVKAELNPKKDGDPQVDQRMEQIADSFVGLSANFAISSRGMLKSYSNIVNDGLDPLVKQAIQGTEDALPSIVIPFPEAPVGVGAKWSVTRQFKSRGVDLTRVAVYELTKFENATGTVTVNVEQNARPGDVEVESRPAAKQRVIKMTTTSTGAHDFSLTKILPRMGSLAAATEADTEVEFAPGEKQVMHLEMKATQKTTETTAPVNPVTSGQTTSRSGAIASGCNLPSPNRDFVAVSAKSSHALGLRKDGVIVAFQGWNRYGECDVPEPNRDFMAISTGKLVSFGLKKDGFIVAWGCKGDFGRLNIPEPNRDFVAISSGDSHSLGLKKDGSVVAWGENRKGQCEVPEPNRDLIAVSAGSDHSLGLKRDGSVVAWGDNSSGECNVPEPNRDFVAIAAGWDHSLGLKEDGTIVAWQDNNWGGCTVPEPNTDFVAVSAGLGYYLAVKKDGSIVGWGEGYSGRTKAPDPNRDFIGAAAAFMASFGIKKDGSIVAWGQCPPPFPQEL